MTAAQRRSVIRLRNRTHAALGLALAWSPVIALIVIVLWRQV